MKHIVPISITLIGMVAYGIALLWVNSAISKSNKNAEVKATYKKRIKGHLGEFLPPVFVLAFLSSFTFDESKTALHYVDYGLRWAVLISQIIWLTVVCRKLRKDWSEFKAV
jgi:hypothetical protein